MHLPVPAQGWTLNKDAPDEIQRRAFKVNDNLYQSLALELGVNAGAACFVTTTCVKGGPLKDDPREFPLRSAYAIIRLSKGLDTLFPPAFEFSILRPQDQRELWQASVGRHIKKALQRNETRGAWIIQAVKNEPKK
jgi:hypothetical protein